MSQTTTTTTNTHINIEQLTTYYNYLDSILPVLSDIYKCPCEQCIVANTEKINNMIPNIQEFYYFLIDCKVFIKNNDIHLKKIKELIPNMLKFNNVIIKDIVCLNTQIGVSVLYGEHDGEHDGENFKIHSSTTKHSIFTLDLLFQYYPELRVEFIY